MRIYTHSLMSVAVVAMALSSASCIDENYDLSDIDTTTRVSVNDLVIPLNIDKIALKSIIDIKDDDPHIKIIDNAYAYVQSGDFNSGGINVKPVTINAATTASIDMSLPINLPAVDLGFIENLPLSVDIPTQSTTYDFEAKDISDDICDIETIDGDCNIAITVKVTGLNATGVDYEFNGLQLKLPEGMTITNCQGCSYDAASQSLVINAKTSTPQISISCMASKLTLAKGQFNEANHSIKIDGTVGIINGKLNLNIHNPSLGSISSLGLKVDYSFGNIEVKQVTGTLKYSIDNVDIPEINISDLPDVLSQPGTNLVLTNPCLYLSVNNPLYTIGAYAQTGFDITSYHGDASQKYSIDKPYFTIAANEIDNLCFSPYMPSNPDAEFAGCQHVPFTSLSNVLSGDGLPDKLKVDLVNPCVPRQRIVDFKLGYDYGKIHGNYKFVAPLQFNAGTAITYSDRVDDWDSEDLEDLTITRLEVNMNVTTDIPVGVEFTAHPLDKKGNRIPGVEVQGAKIDANANNQAVRISVTGTISDINGLEFEAKAAAAADGKALSPDMTISLTNIRPCVSGYYQTEL